MLQRALTEAGPQLAATPTAKTVAQLAEDLRGIEPDDLRKHHLLRQEIAVTITEAENKLWEIISNTKLEVES